MWMFTVGCDFDGTIAEDDFPGIGEPKMDVIGELLELQKCGADIILWTCRENDKLKDALEFCKGHGLEFVAVNDNSPDRKSKMTESDIYAQHKIHANIYVDDKSPGSIDYFVKINAKATCDNFS